LYGYSIYFKYFAWVRENELVNIFTPIGKEIEYVIDGHTFLMYEAIPIMVYHSNHNIEVMEEQKLDLILNAFFDRLVTMGKKLYRDDGVRILYINQTPIFSSDERIVTLIRDKPPKQSVYRALIDISDQLFDHNPRADVKLVFYLEGKYKQNIPGRRPPFFMQYLTSFMQFKYDEHNLYFFNKDIGAFKYDIKTGMITSVLTKGTKQLLINKFLFNYTPDVTSDLKMQVMAMEINVNYRSIIYN
jgi:hypothetical protein